MSARLTRSRGSAAPIAPAVPIRGGNRDRRGPTPTPASTRGGGRASGGGTVSVGARAPFVPLDPVLPLVAPLPPPPAGAASTPDPASEISPQISSFITQAIMDGIAALQAPRNGMPPLPTAPGYNVPTPSINLGASFNRVAAMASPAAPPLFREALFSPFHGGSPAPTPGSGGGGSTMGQWDRSKMLKNYKEKLEGSKLLWSATTSITKLNEAFKVIGPIIMRDARTWGDPRQQMDWAWSAFQELTPIMMWEAFTLNAHEDIGLASTLEDLIQLLAKHLFKQHLNPDSSRRQFEAFSFEYRTTYLQSMAMELLSLAKTGCVSGALYVDKVLEMASKCPAATTIRDFWKVGEGATYLTQMGMHAFNADPTSLDALGRRMLHFLERVQTLLPALVEKVPPTAPVIAALRGGKGSIPFPCKNCGLSTHYWNQCPLPYKPDFPRCTHAICVSRNKFLGHTLETCFNEHPDLRIKKRGDREQMPGSPSKRARFEAETEGTDPADR